MSWMILKIYINRMHKNNRKTNDQKLSLNVSCYVSCYTLCNESKNEQISSGYILVCNRLTPHPRHVLGIQPCTHCMDFSSNTQNIKRKINESILLNSVKTKIKISKNPKLPPQYRLCPDPPSNLHAVACITPTSTVTRRHPPPLLQPLDTIVVQVFTKQSLSLDVVSSRDPARECDETCPSVCVCHPSHLPSDALADCNACWARTPGVACAAEWPWYCRAPAVGVGVMPVVGNIVYNVV